MDKTSIKDMIPLRNYIIAQVVIQATKSGIILSESAKEHASQTVTAVKVGPDVKDVKVGDVLLLHPYNVQTDKLNLSSEYMLLSEDVVIAVKRDK